MIYECPDYISWIEKENFNLSMLLFIVCIVASHFDYIASKLWGMNEVLGYCYSWCEISIFILNSTVNSFF